MKKDAKDTELLVAMQERFLVLLQFGKHLCCEGYLKEEETLKTLEMSKFDPEETLSD